MSDLKRDVLNAYTGNTLLELIDACRYPDRDALVQVLGELDQAREIDVIACILSGQYPSDDRPRLFTIKGIFELLMPRLDREANRVMECVSFLFSSAAGDLSAGWIFEPFTNYCKVDQGRALAAIEVAKSDPEKFGLLLPAALQALSAHDFANSFDQCMALSSNKAISLRQQGLFSFGRLQYPASDTEGHARKALDHLVSTMQSNVSDREFVSCMRACASLPAGLSLESTSRWLMISLQSAGPDRPEVIHQIAVFLAYMFKEIPGNYIEQMAKSLLGVKSENGGTVGVIDMALLRMVEGELISTALAVVEGLVLRAEDPIKRANFDSFNHAIMSKHLSVIMTRWFISGERELCTWISEMVSSIHGNHVSIPIDKNEVDGKSDVCLLFIARKSIGYLNSHPITASSIVISCAELCENKEVRSAICDLLLDPLMLNFSGKLLSYLKSRRENFDEPVRNLIDERMAKHDAWLDELRKTPDFPELGPTSRQRDIHMRWMQEVMQSSYEEASKKSVLMQLVSKRTILYGSRAAGMAIGIGAEGKRYETEMSSSSVEVEIPRLTSVDPWTFDMTMRTYRVERLTGP